MCEIWIFNHLERGNIFMKESNDFQKWREEKADRERMRMAIAIEVMSIFKRNSLSTGQINDVLELVVIEINKRAHL